MYDKQIKPGRNSTQAKKKHLTKIEHGQKVTHIAEIFCKNSHEHKFYIKLIVVDEHIYNYIPN